jgi:hypothetical protein
MICNLFESKCLENVFVALDGELLDLLKEQIFKSWSNIKNAMYVSNDNV